MFDSEKFTFVIELTISYNHHLDLKVFKSIRNYYILVLFVIYALLYFTIF